MEWKEILQISVSGNNAYKAEKKKTKGKKRHIQVRKLVEDIEKSKKQIFEEAKYQRKFALN